MAFTQRIRSLGQYLPPLNFITIHYLYFIGSCLLSSLIFWGSSTPARSISYTDSLFLVVSAMTEAGLNTVNLSSINTFQQVILFLHIIFGSAIFVSAFVVHFRLKAFESRFRHIIEAEKERRKPSGRTLSFSRSFSRGRSTATGLLGSRIDGPPNGTASATNAAMNEAPEKHENARLEATSDVGQTQSEAEDAAEKTRGSADEGQDKIELAPRKPEAGDPENNHIAFVEDNGPNVVTRRHPRVLTFAGVGASPVGQAYRRPSTSAQPQPGSTGASGERPRSSQLSEGGHHLLSFLDDAVTGRNGQFHGLSREQREHLGGVEYRAILLLGWIVPIYLIAWQLLAALGLGAYMAHSKAQVAGLNAVNPWWLGIFNAASAFNNSGMSLLDANMIPFQTSPYTLITMGILILAGNTAYPIFLRLILWTLYRLVPDNEAWAPWKATLHFTLQYPRRVYTNLFPSEATWWLFASLVALNCTDWIAFELLNIGNSATEAIPANYRVLDGLFQAVAVRSGGFYVIAIPSLRIGLQVLYVLMMYISAFPVTITMRNSNVYEERSLGIYADDPAEKDDPELNAVRKVTQRIMGRSVESGRGYFVQQQLRSQLAHDLWWLMLSILLITCIEVGNFDRDPITYSVFNVAFEVVSGYGTVGISTGLPNEAYSFCGGWHIASKLILCAVMLRGRHRGLPVAIDRAIVLPGEHTGRKEEEDWELKREKSRSRIDLGEMV